MYLTHQLFNPEEALVRLGETRQLGCLAIVGHSQSVHLFVENGAVVNAVSGEKQGEEVLSNAFNIPDSSYVWIPDCKPTQKTININISTFALKSALAKDIHIASTGRVPLPTKEKSDPVNTKIKRPKTYYLTAPDRAGEKLLLLKPTVVLGRDESCDVVLSNIQVSRRHCLIQIISRGVSFRDLASTNGIMVNGLPAESGLLNPHDTLHFGTYVLTVHREN